MKYYVDTENISLDYAEYREGHEDTPYRITLYDKYGHFDSDVYLTESQMEDLLSGLTELKEK